MISSETVANLFLLVCLSALAHVCDLSVHFHLITIVEAGIVTAGQLARVADWRTHAAPAGRHWPTPHLLSDRRHITTLPTPAAATASSGQCRRGTVPCPSPPGLALTVVILGQCVSSAGGGTRWIWAAVNAAGRREICPES